MLGACGAALVLTAPPANQARAAASLLSRSNWVLATALPASQDVPADWGYSLTGRLRRAVSPSTVPPAALGHGKLSAKILELHPTATVTISDLDPTSVANIAAGELGTHPRARTQVIDATAIDGHDHSYDLAVFALAFHHLPPTVACKAIAEATRVGKRFLIIDLKRQKPLSFTLSSVLLLPLHLLLLPWSSMRSSMHDGFISALRAYTPSALQTLARAADPGMQVEILPAPTRLFPPSLAVVFSRSSSAPTESSECSADRQPGE